ncbi:tetratricopeptide repeat-containing sensor histidine kinase [Cellulophaga baltica]|uniref:tetratricopeptide repeat-containing sensor histidine kinase n=1 Tax=Cellulophaga baltica TaxID=76594 RepID=UPI00040AA92B|nr:sensor histidine kinase [Cellulophaga baltica]AIY13252.1 histidine kinase [Cellulophaga baltica NN016038]MBA6313194.1 histidine kinase [Cellulophaga baltica]
MYLQNFSYTQKTYLLFIYVYFLFSAIGLSQGKEKDSSNIAPMVYFGWSQRTTPKSLEPYYKELKTAEYGVQRFSIIDQLLEYHIRKTNTDSVVHYANLYLKEVNNWSQTEKIKKRYSSKANYYLGKGNLMNGLYDNAIKWFLEGLKEAEETNFTEFKYKHKLGLSKSYISQGNTDKAIGILEKSLSEFAPEHPSLKTQNYILLGKAYRFNENYEQANMYYNEAVKLSKSLDDEEVLLTIRLEIAKLKEAQGDFDGAFPEYEKTRNEAKEKGFDAIYFEGSLLVARLYYKQGFYDIAVLGLSTAYINAIDSDNLQFQRESLILQSRSFQQQGDFENAYASMTQLFRVINEINTKQQQAIIKELEVQYETLEKEKEINSLEEDKLLKEAQLSRQKTIKNAFLIGFLIILIPIIALLFVYYQKLQTQSELSKKQEEINTQKVKSLIQEQELNLIKASIEGQDEERKRIAQELHDSIGGNLAGIKLQLSSLAKGSEALKTINNQIDETYQLVRDISHTLIPKKFQQNAFTDLVQQFANSISKTNAVQVAFYPHPKETINNIDEKIQVELFKILQELMTNTLKHAKAKNVDIHLNLIGDELSLLFEDNGIGFNTLEKETGIGLKNITSRIQKLKGTLHIDSSENRGTVIAIEIPDLKKTVHEL